MTSQTLQKQGSIQTDTQAEFRLLKLALPLISADVTMVANTFYDPLSDRFLL